MELDRVFNDQKLLLNDKTPDEVLERAKELIKDREAYVTISLAEDNKGERVKPGADSAVSWNLEGAIARVSNPWFVTPAELLRFLDQHVFVFISSNEKLSRYVAPDYFSTFGDFGQWASHDVAIEFLESATKTLREYREQNRL